MLRGVVPAAAPAWCVERAVTGVSQRECVCVCGARTGVEVSVSPLAHLSESDDLPLFDPGVHHTVTACHSTA